MLTVAFADMLHISNGLCQLIIDLPIMELGIVPLALVFAPQISSELDEKQPKMLCPGLILGALHLK